MYFKGMLFTVFGFVVACLGTKLLATDVSGNVSGHWTVSGSPYVAISDITLASGDTLVIDPGVQVRFQAGTRFVVQGNLLAQGTQGSHIHWTSDAVTPAPGDWAGLDVQRSGANSLACWDLSYAMVGLNLSGSGVSAFVSHCAFSQVGDRAIAFDGWSDPINYQLSVDSSSFTNCWTGISKGFSGGPVSVTGCVFTHTGLYSTAVLMSKLVHMDYFSGNSASGTGGGYNGIYVMDWEDPRFTNAGMAYVISGGPGGGSGSAETSAVLKFDSGSLFLSGMTVMGAAGNPVFLTSIRNDAVGGDTNADGSATSPSPSDYGGVVLSNSLSASYLSASFLMVPVNLQSGSAGSSLDHGVFSDIGDRAIAFDGWSDPINYQLSVDSSSFTNCWTGISKGFSGGPVSVTGCVFTHTGLYSTAVLMSKLVHMDYFSGNSASGTGGGYNGICVMDWEDPRFTNAGMAYVINSGPGGGTGLAEAGAVIKFDSSSLFLSGLSVNGTAARPVAFTSLKDDSAAGDTNADGDTTHPSMGDWGSVVCTSGFVQEGFFRYASTGLRVIAGGSGTISLLDTSFYQCASGLSLESGAVPLQADKDLFYRCQTGVANMNASGGRISYTSFAGCNQAITNSSGSLKLGDHGHTDPLDVGQNLFYCNGTDIWNDGAALSAQDDWWSHLPPRIGGSGGVAFLPTLGSPPLETALTDILVTKEMSHPPDVDAVVVTPVPATFFDYSVMGCSASLYRGFDPSQPLSQWVITGGYEDNLFRDTSPEARDDVTDVYYRLVLQPE